MLKERCDRLEKGEHECCSCSLSRRAPRAIASRNSCNRFVMLCSGRNGYGAAPAHGACFACLPNAEANTSDQISDRFICMQGW